MSKVEVKRMWPGGPLRQFAKEKQGGWVSYEAGGLKGFAGMYICDKCALPAPMGIYGPLVSETGEKIWLCGPCQDELRKSKGVNAP